MLYIFLLINKKIGLNLNTLIVLYLVLFILLLINPFYVFDLGFIYSFMTAFGLIIFNKKIQGGYIKKIMLVSTIAFMFSLPITLYNFYEFNLLTILNNIIIVPFVSIGLFPLALITFIFPFLDILLVYGIKILEFINSTLNVFSINIIVAKINIVFIFIYYIGVYLIYKKGYRYIGLLVLLVFICTARPGCGSPRLPLSGGSSRSHPAPSPGTAPRTSGSATAAFPPGPSHPAPPGPHPPSRGGPASPPG